MQKENWGRVKALKHGSFSNELETIWQWLCECPVIDERRIQCVVKKG